MPTITALPAFNDNYIWLLQNPATRRCAVVDPGDAAPVQQWLQENPGWSLDVILITHHHQDHTGGVASLKETTGAAVYGPSMEKMAIAGVDHALADNQLIEVLGQEFQVLHVPGHTLGHIAFYRAGEHPLLFSGDTLFLAGCGRIFEGTAQQMYDSLQRLAALPPHTKVYCTHEYSLSNLKFAKAADPDNAEVNARLAEVTRLREEDLISLPSSIALEQATNPFLRCNQSGVISTVTDQEESIDSADPVAVFAALRGWKDRF